MNKPDIRESWENYLQWWVETYPPESGAEHVREGLEVMKADVASMDPKNQPVLSFKEKFKYFIQGFMEVFKNIRVL